jgi:hypothetical protein
MKARNQALDKPGWYKGKLDCFVYFIIRSRDITNPRQLGLFRSVRR